MNEVISDCTVDKPVEGLIGLSYLRRVEAGAFMGRVVSSRTWYVLPGQELHIIGETDEIHMSEYDALGELAIFLVMTYDACQQTDNFDQAERVRSFHDEATYLHRPGFRSAIEFLTNQWANRVYGQGQLGVLMPNANDNKDRGVGSSEYILSHILESLRRTHGPEAARRLVLVKPGRPDSLSEAEKCQELICLDDWMITGNQIRRIITSLPKELSNKISVQLLAHRGDSLELSLEDGHTIELRSVFRAPAIKDVHEGPSIIGAHSSVNYGWQNRLTEFALTLANHVQRPIPLPVMTHIERPYRTRKDTPKSFKTANSSST